MDAAPPFVAASRRNLDVAESRAEHPESDGRGVIAVRVVKMGARNSGEKVETAQGSDLESTVAETGGARPAIERIRGRFAEKTLKIGLYVRAHQPRLGELSLGDPQIGVVHAEVREVALARVWRHVSTRLRELGPVTHGTSPRPRGPGSHFGRRAFRRQTR